MTAIEDTTLIIKFLEKVDRKTDDIAKAVGKMDSRLTRVETKLEDMGTDKGTIRLDNRLFAVIILAIIAFAGIKLGMDNLL